MASGLIVQPSPGGFFDRPSTHQLAAIHSLPVSFPGMAEPGIPLRRTVTLISGPDAVARRACIAQLRGQRRGMYPTGEDDSLWLQAGEVPSAPLAVQSLSPAACAPDQTLTAGCICCLGGPVFRTTLVRLLRQPAWKHLYLEVSREGEHLLRVVDQLRQPPFDQHLRLVSLVRATGSGLRTDEGRVLTLPAAVLSGGHDPATGWASSTWVDGQWYHHDPMALDEQGLSWGTSVTAGPVLRLACRWLPEVGVPTRQEAQEALQALVETPGVQRMQAVLQTGRSGYDWRFAAGEATAVSVSQGSTDPAEIARSGPNLSAALRSRETVWRLDNRLWLGLAQGMDLARLQRGINTLQALWS